MDVSSIVLFAVVVCGLVVHLSYKAYQAKARESRFPFDLFKEVLGLFDGVQIKRGQVAGSYKLTGIYRGHSVQVETVVDSLAIRKPPSLWVMVTMPATLPIEATLDLMMRAAGPTTFSNFDHLPYTLNTEPGLPEHALVRTDNPDKVIPLELIKPHLEMYFQDRAKELLITPKGIRIVSHLAKADRARYGVLRQADFGEVVIGQKSLIKCLDRMIEIRFDIESWREDELKQPVPVKYSSPVEREFHISI